jgi:hypothetical protein
MDNESAPSRLTGWLIPAIVVFAVLVGGWFIFAPNDNSIRSVGKPSAPQTDNSGQARPTAPTQGGVTPDTQRGQGNGGAGSDSARGTDGPTNPTQTR